jgi:hypothetical protein
MRTLIACKGSAIIRIKPNKISFCLVTETPPTCSIDMNTLRTIACFTGRQMITGKTLQEDIHYGTTASPGNPMAT